MFKYGSLRIFLIKVLAGFVAIIFSVIFLISLATYDNNDPGFKTFINNKSDLEIHNYFGLVGAYIASYSIIMIGNLSYLTGLFIFIEGFKNLIGFSNHFLLLRFICNISGILIVGVFLHLYSSYNLSSGLLSIFLSDIFAKYFYAYLKNNILIYLFNLLFFVIGVFLIIYSFKIKISVFNKIFTFLKIFRFLKYFIFIFKIKKLFEFKRKKTLTNTRNEPTIRKNYNVNSISKVQKFSKNYKQLEIDQFRFSLPKNNLLNKSPKREIFNKELNKFNNESADKLEKTLSEYGVEGKVVGFKTGPIVTLFEFIPKAGVKSSKIISLSDDIARAMSSFSARISSQPGKTSLGIEIPNNKREGVLFGDLIEDERFNSEPDTLTLALGKNISGEKIFTDLEKMPHLLIAGTTGSGKSVGINTMILSLLYKFKPNECKLILIDPKMLELSIYEDIPHLLTPVVTDPKKAVFALKWVVREMENRYKLMSSINVKNISSYNNKVLRNISSGKKLFREVQTGIDPDTKIPILEKKEIKLEKMPFIVVIIDEMADLMMVAGKEVEALVQRLAQMARASGIHLITATQRPSVDVITGTIKANFPSRISYKVASKFDSRTILNEMGAEQLLGSGDMLFLENGGNIKRLHGGFVSESEVEKVVNSIKNQATFDYKKEISLENLEETKTTDTDLISGNNDELYNKAVEIVIKQQKVSTSYIQRYLQIGYNRAARIVEKMEEDGIITEANNAGKRHVLKK